MPKFSTDPHTLYFCQGESNSLIIELDKDEPLTDSVLDNVSSFMNHRGFIKIRHGYIKAHSIHDSYLNHPIKIKCTPEKLGQLNPVDLFFECHHSGLEDDLFEYCTNLQYLGLGSSAHKLFNFFPNNLNKQPLKLITSGYAEPLRMGDGLKKMIQFDALTTGRFTYHPIL